MSQFGRAGRGRIGSSVRGPTLLVIALGFTLALGSPAGAQQWTVTGQVIDETLAGVPNVDIDVIDPLGNELSLSGDLTDANGNFSVTFLTDPNPPVAGFHIFEFNPPLGSPYFDLVVEVFVSGSGDIGVFTLLVGWYVEGFVFDENGIGIPQVDLEVTDSSGMDVDVGGDFTDPTGFYRIRLRPDFYDIKFRPTMTTPGGPYVPTLLRDRAVFADTVLPDVVLRNGYPITGSVVDGNGAPVPNADLDLVDPITGETVATQNDNTDLMGNFSFLGPTGDWKVEVDPPVGPLLVSQVFDFTVVAGPNDLGMLVLPFGVIVSGRTVDTNTVPVPDVDLDFVITATQQEIPTAHDNANDMGLFSVVVENDTYDIQFRPPFGTGLAPRVLDGQVVNGNLALGDVVLFPGFALTGTVTSGGVPVEDVAVTLTDSATGDPVYVFGNDTDGLGEYGLRQVAGTYDVLFTPPAGSGLPSHLEPDVNLNTDVVLDVDLSGGTPTPPVENLVCSVTASDVQLTWTNGAVDYASIVVNRDGVPIATLPGSATAFDDLGLADGTYLYEVVAQRDGQSSVGVTCQVTVNQGGGTVFVRGDPNVDGSLNVADAIFLLDFLFSMGAEPLPCLDSGDVNDDGGVNVADAIYLLAYLFDGGAAPPPPFPDPGLDPTPDPIPCP